MKKRYVKIVVALFLLLVIVIFYFPRSLDEIIHNNSNVSIVYNNTNFMNGKISTDSYTYSYLTNRNVISKFKICFPGINFIERY